MIINDELKELLIDKKVADAYQYYQAAYYKLYLANITIMALENIVNDFCSSSEDAVKYHLNEAFKEGSRYIKDTVDYFGIKISIADATTKLTMESISLLHSFFDIFAQWINAALLGEEALPIESVSLNKLIKKLFEYPEYRGDFLDEVTDILKQEEYLFISDFNNTMKHRTQLYTKNSIDILNVKAGIYTPKFSKNNNSYESKEIIDVLKNNLKFCQNELDNSVIFLEEYYSKNSCKYVGSRYYNPKQYIQFKTEEDYDTLRNVDQSYLFIEESPDNIKDEYQIMRYTIDEDGNKELYNSCYKYIVLKYDGRIWGVLCAKDQYDNESAIVYRKYLLKTEDYANELSDIYRLKEGDISLLRDAEIVILNEVQ